jgi:ABC-type branched-subunit amino acid transport system substrate-binding protein
MRDAVRVALSDARSRGVDVSLLAARGAVPVQNPHQDEGSDNDADVAAAPAEIRNLAARGIHVVVGPLRSNVARADAAALVTSNSVAISGTAREPSDTGTRVFKVAPSDRQLAMAAYAWMRRRWGPRACVIDDGTLKARSEAAAFLAIDSSAARATSGRHAIDGCMQHADAIYATALEADPIFCSARTARRAGAGALVQAMGLRSFDPAKFSKAGRLWRAEPAAIVRTAATQAPAQRYHARTFVAATDAALRFYAATQIAVNVARAGGDPAAILHQKRFVTILGAIGFNARGEVRAPPIVIRSID